MLFFTGKYICFEYSNVKCIRRAQDAARLHDIRRIIIIIGQCPDINHQTRARERTLLHELVSTPMLYDYDALDKIITAILEAGGKLEIRDVYGRTPFCQAMLRCKNERQDPREVYQVFVAHGADIDTADKNGETPRDFYRGALLLRSKGSLRGQ
jgi:hypothetical protein